MRGGYLPIQLLWSTARLLVTRVSLVYLVDKLVAKRNENAGWIRVFIFLFLVLIKEMREGGGSKISLSYPRGEGASPQFFRDRGAFSAYGMFVDDLVNGGCFCSIEG